MDQVFLPGTIRDRIKDLMKSTKMTQAELAVRIGTAESTLSRFLRGDTDMTAVPLNAPLHWLWTMIRM